MNDELKVERDAPRRMAEERSARDAADADRLLSLSERLRAERDDARAEVKRLRSGLHAIQVSLRWAAPADAIAIVDELIGQRDTGGHR